MLASRKKNWHNKPQTIETFVETVAEIHATQPKPPKAESVVEAKKEQPPAEPSKLLSGMKVCDLGQSPEVQPRELLKA